MFKLRNPVLLGQMRAMASGILGIMGAAYGNAVLGQMPTGIILYICMVFLFMSPQFDKILEERNAENAKLLK